MFNATRCPMAATTLTPNELESFSPPEGPPARGGLVREVGSAVEPFRLALRTPKLLQAPRGAGRVAVLIPGWRAPEAAMAPIGSYLRFLGHRPQPWGLGTNDGDVEETRDLMIERIARLAEESGQAVNLVGWSLGGVIAREIARSRPDDVHHVLTYGSPVLGGPTHTVGAGAIGRKECERITELQEHLDATDPIRVPITAVFTRNDGAVDWRACIDTSSLDVTTVEVSSTHLGLGIDPDVWLVAAQALHEG